MNLPNKLSLARICMVPLFIVAYFLTYSWTPIVAVALFILAAVTDFLDGYIARKYKMVTDLGKLLDPIADKILICSALFCVVATNPLRFLCCLDWAAFYNGWKVFENYAWAEAFGLILLTVGAIIIISRELLISAVRQIAAAKGVVVQANIFGKIKTVFQDISLPMLVLLNVANFQWKTDVSSVGYTPSQFWVIWWWASVVTFAAAVILTVVSGVIYLIQNRKVFSN